MIKQKELLEIENNILIEVSEYCRVNHIQFFLAYGTLLGAVRHKDFIPWDDDVDIMMLRKDYDFFINNFHHKYLNVYSCETNNNFEYPFAKVSDNRTKLTENGKKNIFSDLGVNIDVFPVDYLPNNNVERLFRYKKSRVYRCLYVATIIEQNKELGLAKYFFSKLVSLFLKKDNINKLLCRWNQNLKKGVNGDEKLIACMVWGYGKKEIMLASKLLPFSTVIFNKRQYAAPKDTHYYLNNLYGNYLELPPIEKQVSHHDFVAYYKHPNRV